MRRRFSLRRLERRHDELAAAVSDGAGVDWTSVEAAARSDAERELLRCLRLVERIADVHATAAWQSYATPGGSFPAGPGDGVTPAEPPPEWGPLKLLERIGSGTFGDVYRAWDRRLDREVALKLLRPRSSRAVAPNDRIESAFVEEARLMAKVRHPNVGTVYGAERIAGRAGFWMELVQGATLEQDLLERGSFSPEEIVRVGTAVCEAVAAVHCAGLLHRDVKAQNVMRDVDGRVVLMDFGTGLEANQADPGPMAGTPLYLAPEVLNGEAPTTNSELYSVGVLLYHLATRSFPVTGRTVREVRHAHGRGARRTLGDTRPDLPKPLIQAVDRALDVEPSARYADAAVMADALRAAGEWPRRGRRLRWAAALGGILLTLAGAYTQVGRSPSTLSSPSQRIPVLVAAFENLTGDPMLDGTLQHAFERDLSTSALVSIVPDDRIQDTLRLMQRPPEAAIDAPLAREVALRDGAISAFVVGDVQKTDGGYLLSVRVVGPTDGETIFAVEETVRDATDVLSAVRRASFGVRKRLGEDEQTVQASRAEYEKVTTPSLRALHLYSQAVALARFDGSSANPAAAERLLLEAVKVDPEFASAHILLAYVVNEQEGRLGEVIAHAERAVARADRVTEVERLFITATHQKFLGRATQDREEWARLYNSAAASYEALLRLQPDHYWALDRLTLTYSNLGRAPDAARASLVLASMRPNSGRWYAWAAYEMLRAGDLPEAVRLAAEARTRMNPGEYEIDPAMGGLAVMDAQIAWMRGDVTEALRVTDAVWASRELLRSGARRTDFGMQVAYMYLALGRLSQAEEAAGWIPDGPLRFQALAGILSAAGDPAPLHALVRGSRFDELRRIPTILIDTGLLDEARRVIARQAVKSEIALGLLAAAEGRHAEAIPMLERATARLGPAWSLGWLKAARRLAEVYDSKGHLTRAVQTLERASQLPLGEVTSLWSAGSQWLLMRAQLADLYRKTGRASEAQRIDSELQQLLLVADPDHPLTRRN